MATKKNESTVMDTISEAQARVDGIYIGDNGKPYCWIHIQIRFENKNDHCSVNTRVDMKTMAEMVQQKPRVSYNEWKTSRAYFVLGIDPKKGLVAGSAVVIDVDGLTSKLE